MKDPKSVKNDKQALRVLGLEASSILTLSYSDKGVCVRELLRSATLFVVSGLSFQFLLEHNAMVRLDCVVEVIFAWVGEEVRAGCGIAV